MINYSNNYHRFGKENSYLFIKSILVQLTDNIFHNTGRIIAINLKSSKYQEQREQREKIGQLYKRY